ncbi:MAG: Gmad2 immunoglobulin-like domain-containing protein [Vitreimonas sp.]
MLKHLLFAVSAAALIGCSPAPSSKAPEAPIAVPALTSPTTVSSPAPFARVTSPLTVTGISRGWYFEGSFPAHLEGADGHVIAEAPAQAQGDWMTSAPVPFSATLIFTVTQDTPANIVLEQDMPREGQEPQRVTIPVVLVAH